MESDLFKTLHELDTLTQTQRQNLVNHISNYSKNCSGCLDCKFNINVLEIYDLYSRNVIFINEDKSLIYRLAYNFVANNYPKILKNDN